MTPQDNPGIDNRKDLLLLVLGAAGSEPAEPVLGVTRLQKYLFLLQEDHRWHEKFGMTSPYDFEAYDYGPFDSQLYADLELLENVGLIQRKASGDEPGAEHDEMRHLAFEWATSDPEVLPWEEETAIQEYSLTEKGRAFVSENLQLAEEDRAVLEEMKRKWNRAPLNRLLRWLYETHEDYARETKLRNLLRREPSS
jgi:hypothetical protein